MFICLLFSCKNGKEASKNNILENTYENSITNMNEIDLTTIQNKEEDYLKTINGKLNIIIPEIGEEYFTYLYSFIDFDLLKDRKTYGYEELIEQLQGSYLMVPLYPSKKEAEAIIFNKNGPIRIYAQVVDGRIPAAGDGERFQLFITLGKFIYDYDEEYYKSKVFSDEIIVTFHNYKGSYDNEENETTWNYKIYAYYKMIE